MAKIRGSILNKDALITALFDEHQPLLHRYAISLAHNADQADDLVQETFSRALPNAELLARLNDHQRRAWLFRVLRNRFLDERRRDRRSDQLVRQLTNQAQGGLEAPMIPLEWMAVLDDAPRRYRELLRKRYELCMTSAEIGRELGIPSATVRSRLRLAIQWLRDHCLDS
ncbi:sigma-70 family RNA polymerase sigma factor [Candidatus Bipolaricaulota bacterium]|nr:sigma-70 family RNA polymerase sigma factor [Candidatus Bipolaricaulota bacterium]